LKILLGEYFFQTSRKFNQKADFTGQMFANFTIILMIQVIVISISRISNVPYSLQTLKYRNILNP